MIISRSNPVAANGIIFLWLSKIPLYIGITSSLSTHLSMDIYIVSTSWLLSTERQWTLGDVSFWIMFFSGYMPKSGMAGLCGISIFNFLRNLQPVVHGGCSNLQSPQQYRRVKSGLWSHTTSSELGAQGRVARPCPKGAHRIVRTHSLKVFVK